jgi:hypothetical protein
MRKYGKKYQEAQKLVEVGKTYTILEAAELIKNHHKKIVNYEIKKQFSAYDGGWVTNIKFCDSAGHILLILRFEEK